MANDFEDELAFPGNQAIRLVVVMDEYPWEIGLELRTSDKTLIWYRPPRYYSRQVKETVVEIISLPEKLANYTLTVGDTFGDGLGEGAIGIRITTQNGKELASTSFQTGERESLTFTYDGSDKDSSIPESEFPNDTFGPTPASAASPLSPALCTAVFLFLNGVYNGI